MITAVDSSVLYDILLKGSEFVEASSTALRRCRREGSLVACEIVWAELSAAIGASDELRRRMERASIAFSPATLVAAEKAGAEWRHYRARGGSRTRLIGDFLIAAHAMEQADRLLTRDRGFFRTYFTGLQVVDPTRT